MDWAPTATPRWVMRYRSARIEHTFLVRGYRNESQAATEARAANFANAYFDALKGKLADDLLFISARYIPQDSNVSVVSVLPTAVTGSNALNLFKNKHRAMEGHFAGSTGTGAKAGFNIFGLLVDAGDDTNPDDNDYIITGNEDTDVAAAIAVINGFNLAGIDNSQITVVQQMTIKQNDYWIKRIRKGA